MRIFNEEKTQELFDPDLEKGRLRPDKLFKEHHEAIPEKVIKTVEQIKEELEREGKEVNLRTRQGDDGDSVDEYYVVTQIYYIGDKRVGNDEELIEAEKEEGKEAWDLPQRIASIAFVKMAEKGEIDDMTATECVYAFTPWQPNVKYEAENLREYEGALYRCISGHTSQADWTPDVTASLWKKVGDPREGYPKWSQPISSFDTYKKGDKVTHNGQKWISEYDANVWEPGVFGWKNVEE